jgi:hypothetical protein
MFSHSDVLDDDKSTSSDEIIRKEEGKRKEEDKKEGVKEKEVEVEVEIEEQAGGEGMEWHSDGSKGEFTMLLSFEGDAYNSAMRYPSPLYTVLYRLSRERKSVVCVGA